MSNEITVNGQMRALNGSLDVTKNWGALRVDQAAAGYVGNVQEIGFATHEALAMGDVSTAGYAQFRNLDATNYVEVGVDVAATFYPFLKLKPGEGSGPVRLGTSAPYAQADTGAVKLDYLILED